MEQVIGRLRETGEAVAVVVGGLSDGQWTWRAAEGGWTAQEIVEHLILVERRVLERVRVAERAPSAGMSDDEVWRRLTAPGRRAEAPEPVLPKGEYWEREAAVREFGKLREATVRYAETTEDPLRELSIPMTAGNLDGVQALLMLSAHCLRHLRQLDALRGAHGFPAA